MAKMDFIIEFEDWKSKFEKVSIWLEARKDSNRDINFRCKVGNHIEGEAHG